MRVRADRGWVHPHLGQIQHCNVLHATYRKTSEQQCKVIHTGIGYPPLSVKFNTVTCYARLTAKHPSNGARSSTPGLGNPPLSVKFDTVTCYARLTAKHPSKGGRLSRAARSKLHVQIWVAPLALPSTEHPKTTTTSVGKRLRQSPSTTTTCHNKRKEHGRRETKTPNATSQAPLAPHPLESKIKVTTPPSKNLDLAQVDKLVQDLHPLPYNNQVVYTPANCRSRKQWRGNLSNT